MNNIIGREKFKNFQILFKIVCSSKIVIRRLVEKLCLKKDDVMQWRTQVRHTTTNIKVKVDFTLTPLSATHVVNRDCHVDESSKGRYDMILGRVLLT